MADSTTQQTNTNPGFLVTTTLQITIAIVVLNFILFVVILLFYIGSKGYFRTVRRPSRSSRLVFVPDNEPAVPRQALDPSVLNSLPVTVFRSDDFKDYGGLECAVCLCELTDGEETRLLPKCKHGFHVDCIDMWFHSNSTCPLCRTSVSLDTSLAQPSHDHNLDTIRPSSLVIDIPGRTVNGFLSSLNSGPLSLALSRASPRSPYPIRSPGLGRMRSMNWRMLSRAGPSSTTPRDLEKGELATPKCQ